MQKKDALKDSRMNFEYIPGELAKPCGSAAYWNVSKSELNAVIARWDGAILRLWYAFLRSKDWNEQVSDQKDCLCCIHVSFFYRSFCISLLTQLSGTSFLAGSTLLDGILLLSASSASTSIGSMGTFFLAGQVSTQNGEIELTADIQEWE